MKRNSLERLQDARHFAQEASQIASGMPPEIFEDIRYYHYALRYCLLAIGEALRGVPAELQAAAPDITWKPIISLRHRLAHDYWLVDSRLILEVGIRQTDILLSQIDRLITLVERDTS